MNNFQENLNIVPSGYRILYVLFLLTNYNLSQNEINEKMSQNPDIEQSFTKDTLLKIINTLKAADIKIDKRKNKYFVSKVPWHFDFDPKYLNTFFQLGYFVNSLEQKELLKKYNAFLDGFFKYIPEDVLLESSLGDCCKEKKYQKYSKFIKKIEIAKQHNARIKINFDNEICVFDSYFVEYSLNEVFLTGYNVKSHENKTVNLNEIKTIKQLPQKASGMFFPSNVTFKVTGRLMKSYNLRENEKLLFFDDEKMVILNKGEDKQILLKRLLKYKNLCEIITPEILRDEFRNILKEMLSQYEKL